MQLFWVLLLWSSRNMLASSFVASHGMSSEFLVKQHVALERQTRYLIYPKGEFARVQLIMGVGLPVDLEDEAVTIGYIFRMFYALPQLPEDYLAHNTFDIVRAFDGNTQSPIMTEGNYTKEPTISININRIRNTSKTANVYEIFNENNGYEIEEMSDEINRKICTKKHYTETEINEDEGQNYEKQEKIEHDPIVKGYFVPKYEFRNGDKNVYKQSDNIKNIEGETVVEDKENSNKSKSGDDNKANKIRRKRDIVSTNANFATSNKDKEDINGGIAMNTKDEIIRDKRKNNDKDPGSIPDFYLKHEEEGDEELIRPPKTTRWGLYKVFENMLEQKGYEGRACMLRTICEAAETPFTHRNGVLGELVHILLTPSTTQETVSHSSDKDYHTAEKRGLMDGVDCEAMYPDCEESILEMFSEVGFDHLFY